MQVEIPSRLEPDARKARTSGSAVGEWGNTLVGRSEGAPCSYYNKLKVLLSGGTKRSSKTASTTPWVNPKRQNLALSPVEGLGWILLSTALTSRLRNTSGSLSAMVR